MKLAAQIWKLEVGNPVPLIAITAARILKLKLQYAYYSFIDARLFSHWKVQTVLFNGPILCCAYYTNVVENLIW